MGSFAGERVYKHLCPHIFRKILSSEAMAGISLVAVE
jgi:hypothetical protein